MKKFRRAAAVMAAAIMAVVPMQSIQTMPKAEAAGSIVVEKLDRGICAINTGKGMFVSWRFNADDPDNAVFQLYRDNTLIYTSEAGKATSYLDPQGNANSKYRVDTVVNGKTLSSENCGLTSGKSWFDIPLDIPKSGSDYSYTAGDCSVGDVDGDGSYEIILKWDPTNAKDNSQPGVTGNVYIDCYRLTGQKMWRIDLGKNIRAGAHYTQFLVADFDLDGKAEMTCKTGDGTVDGKGKVIGDASKDYRNGSGYVLDGAEYYTLFDGETGAALDTVNYEFPRGNVSSWGDNYGNRVDRFLGAVMYLDGVHPSPVSVRGYYTRMTAVAYDVVDKKLVKRWTFDSNDSANKAAYGNGNHNCMPADVDGDGKQELLLGAATIDDNGKILWCNGKGHGDAMHVGDFIPERPGQELFVCHEHTPFGISLIDAKTGKDIFHFDGDKDTGRACCDNVYAGNPGSEFWGARPAKQVLDQNGKNIGLPVPSMNFVIYWDGDLEREIQSDIGITKINASKQIDTLLYADGCASCNSTKATPCFSGDILGDWREELVLKTSDSKYLRVYCTPYTTDVRLTTLMHDPQYRVQVAGEQNCYNQPPHASFFLGTGYDLPARPDVSVGTGAAVPEPLSGRLVSELNVKDSQHRYSWNIEDNVQVGTKIFGDRDFTFTALPEALKGSELIQTACDSKFADGELAEFKAASDMTVFVAIDSRVENIPEWMNSYEKTSMTASSSNDVTFDIYSKDVRSGESVDLGTNGQSSYCVNYVVLASDSVPKQIKGDVNADGQFNIADLVMMQKWILGSGELTDWTAGDLCEDGIIDAFDMVMMRKFILN